MKVVVFSMSSAYRLAILHLQETLSHALTHSWVFLFYLITLLCVLAFGFNPD